MKYYNKMKLINNSEMEKVISDINFQSKNSSTTNGPKLRKNRIQHYRAAWEKNPLFSSWLRRGCNSRKARCIACSTEITADVSVLKYHATSAKHINKMKSLPETIIIPDGNDSLQNAVKKGHFNPRWEKDERFRSWVLPGSSETSAFCRLCDVELNATPGALRKHMATYGHMKATDFDDQLQAITARTIIGESGESIVLTTGSEGEQEEVQEIHFVSNSDCEADDVANVNVLSSIFQYKDDKSEAFDKLTTLIGKFLLRGQKMLNEACAKCQCVLLLDKKHQKFCVGCQYGIMEEIDGNRKSKYTCHGPISSDCLMTSNVPLGTDRLDPLGTDRLDPLGTDRLDPLGTDRLDPLGTDRLEDEGICVKEEDVEDMAQIIINEDNNCGVYYQVLGSGDPLEDEEGESSPLFEIQGVDIGSEMSSVMSALKSRLTDLTDQLDAEEGDMDTCLFHLDRTVSALIKFKQL